MLIRLFLASLALLMLGAIACALSVIAWRTADVPIATPADCDLVSSAGVVAVYPGEGVASFQVRELRTWDYLCPVRP